MNNKKMNLSNKIILIIIIFSFINISACKLNLDKKKPQKSDIKKIINQIKDEEISKIKLNKFISDLFKHVISWIKNKKNFIKIFVICCVIIITLTISFFLIRFFISKKYAYREKEILKKKFIITTYDKLHLKKLLNQKDFSQAIIYLHHCSIFYLLTKKTAYKKNMTNYDYYHKINDNNMAKAFKKIFVLSEKILFDNYIAKIKDFEICNIGFNEHFIVNK